MIRDLYSPTPIEILFRSENDISPAKYKVILNTVFAAEPRPRLCEKKSPPLSLSPGSLCYLILIDYISGIYFKLRDMAVTMFQHLFPSHFKCFLISFSLFNASIGVRLSISRSMISSLICFRTGSSSWKKLNCNPSL